MNLLNLIQSQLSPQTIGQIGNTIGESPERTKSALGTAVPALLGSLIGKASASPNGANEIFNMLKQTETQRGWFDSSGTPDLAAAAQSPASNSLLQSLLGSKLGGVVNFFTNQFGMKSGSASSLLGMAAPLLMGTLSKHVAAQGMGPSGLGQFLGSQLPFIKNLIPPQLGSILGIDNLLQGDTTRIPTAQAAPQPRAEHVRADEPHPAHAAHQNRGGGVLKWAVIPLLLAFCGWLLLNRLQNRNREATGGTVDYERVETGADRGMRPDTANVQVTPGSSAERLSRALSSGNFSQPVTLEAVADASGNISDAGRARLREIGSVLQANPNIRVRITGYAATEDAALQTANAIKSALKEAGVSEARIILSGEVGSGMPTLTVVRQ